MEPWLDELEVFCADVGSIARSKFAWARRHSAGGDEEVHLPGSIESLAKAVIFQLAHDRPVSLGFEMPLVIPVPSVALNLGKARPCDEGRTPWSQSTGAAVMATGLVQLAWLLERIFNTVPTTRVHLSWNQFCAERSGLFLWEAFVNGPDKDAGGSHEADALIGVEAFCEQLPHPGDARANLIERPLSLAAAAAAWAGGPVDDGALSASVMVVRPRSKPGHGESRVESPLTTGRSLPATDLSPGIEEGVRAEATPRFIEPKLPGGPFLLVARVPPDQKPWDIGPFLRADFSTAPDGSLEYFGGPDHPIGLRIRAQEGNVIHANNGSVDLMSYTIVPWDPRTRAAQPWGWTNDSAWARDGEGPLYQSGD